MLWYIMGIIVLLAMVIYSVYEYIVYSEFFLAKNIGITILIILGLFFLSLYIFDCQLTSPVHQIALSDLEPVTEFQLEEITPDCYAIHSNNGKYYIKYDHSTTDIVNPVIVDLEASKRNSPTIILCQIKPSFLYPQYVNLITSSHKYVLIVSESQIEDETTKLEVEATPSLDWL